MFLWIVNSIVYHIVLINDTKSIENFKQNKSLIFLSNILINRIDMYKVIVINNLQHTTLCKIYAASFKNMILHGRDLMYGKNLCTEK